jgi:hypothetical protein
VFFFRDLGRSWWELKNGRCCPADEPSLIVISPNQDLLSPIGKRIRSVSSRMFSSVLGTSYSAIPPKFCLVSIDLSELPEFSEIPRQQ